MEMEELGKWGHSEKQGELPDRQRIDGSAISEVKVSRGALLAADAS